jgi:hypothetical protein
MASNVISLSSTVSEAERKERALQRDFRAAQLADREIVKLASVSMEGWEREKELRVRNAFDRIVEHGWYDRAESTLKAVELGHINSVREHYAMRRDKIKTPALLQHNHRGAAAAPRNGSGLRRPPVENNTISALEWADNVNALDELSRETHLENHFMGLMERKVAARRRQQQQQQSGSAYGSR